MKIYLASSFSLKDRVIELSNVLEKQGHIITVKWWETDFKKIFGDIPDEEWYKIDKIEKIRDRNFKGIDDADIVILVAPVKESKKFNGANVEIGYAFGKQKRVMSLGKLERSAMYQMIERFNDIESLVNAIGSE